MGEALAGPATDPVVASLQVGLPREVHETRTREDSWRSGLWKTPRDEPVMLRHTNLDGDGQGDTIHHGGPDKAVCVYPLAHYDHWRGDLGRAEIGPGAFGENLTVAGADEMTTFLGDVYRCGDALVEVSQPRAPCWKIARRWDVADLAVKVRDRGMTGWYLRVREEGRIQRGDALRLESRPYPAWPISRVNKLRHGRDIDQSGIREVLDVVALATSWRDALSARVPPNEAGL